MKRVFIAVIMAASSMAVAQTLPVITSSPTNLTVFPGNTATFMVAATGVTGYQWLFDGTNITGATSATLQIANAQSTNCGYYMAVVKNSTGWVPSQMAYLSLDYTYGGTVPSGGGTVPFSNVGGNQADYQSGSPGAPINSGTVQVVAGPELDQMNPVGAIIHFKSSATGTYLNNGYYNYSPGSETVPSVTGGQTLYYSVLFSYTNGGLACTQPSTIIRVTAGGNGYALPSVAALQFPTWIEWPEPIFTPDGGFLSPSTPRNPICIPGETVFLTNTYYAYNDFGIPYGQWRKDGNLIPGATNYIENLSFFEGYAFLAITNVQPGDAGAYDFVLYGNNWMIAPAMTLSVQTTNGQGVFQKPKFAGTNFVCNLVGAAGRNYQVQWSTNLTGWNNLTILSNATGTVTFTNSTPSIGAQFYRTVLVPF